MISWWWWFYNILVWSEKSKQWQMLTFHRNMIWLMWNDFYSSSVRKSTHTFTQSSNWTDPSKHQKYDSIKLGAIYILNWLIHTLWGWGNVPSDGDPNRSELEAAPEISVPGVGRPWKKSYTSPFLAVGGALYMIYLPANLCQTFTLAANLSQN